MAALMAARKFSGFIFTSFLLDGDDLACGLRMQRAEAPVSFVPSSKPGYRPAGAFDHTGRRQACIDRDCSYDDGTLQEQQRRPMHKPKHPPPGGSAHDTEAAFYEALQRADIEGLMACWAEEDDIVCVHPGGPRLLGAPAIRASFEAMFANGSIQARAERVQVVESMACSVHSVMERVDVLTKAGPRHAYVVATNVYQRTPQGWRMVAHHASPGSMRELPEVPQPPQVLH